MAQLLLLLNGECTRERKEKKISTLFFHLGHVQPLDIRSSTDVELRIQTDV
jgi:hypothetical protein